MFISELVDKKNYQSGAIDFEAFSGLSILSVRDSDEAEKIMREAPYVKQLGASYKVIQRDPKFGEFK